MTDRNDRNNSARTVVNILTTPYLQHIGFGLPLGQVDPNYRAKGSPLESQQEAIPPQAASPTASPAPRTASMEESSGTTPEKVSVLRDGRLRSSTWPDSVDAISGTFRSQSLTSVRGNMQHRDLAEPPVIQLAMDVEALLDALAARSPSNATHLAAIQGGFHELVSMMKIGHEADQALGGAARCLKQALAEMVVATDATLERVRTKVESFVQRWVTRAGRLLHLIVTSAGVRLMRSPRDNRLLAEVDARFGLGVTPSTSDELKSREDDDLWPSVRRLRALCMGVLEADLVEDGDRDFFVRLLVKPLKEARVFPSIKAMIKVGKEIADSLGVDFHSDRTEYDHAKSPRG